MHRVLTILISSFILSASCTGLSEVDLPSFPEEMIAHHFDFPVGKPDAVGYYNAQEFGKNKHLGDDWNSVKGGNNDLGDPVFSIAHGYVTFAEDLKGGWGNVMRIVHQLPDSSFLESVYAHLDNFYFKAGDWIRMGDTLGTIGTAHGRYLAHLHLEIRDSLFMPIGPGYSEDTTGYLNPEQFIRTHR